MNQMLISLGSNMTQGEQNMNTAIEQIRALANFARFSSIYETEPVGQHRHARYKNCVAQIHTSDSLDNWQHFFKKLEKEMGRNAESKSQGNVPLDIDIVIWNEDVIRPKDLSAPYIQIGLQEIATL